MATASPTFSELNLNPNVFKALSACGYETPTPIQAQSIPHIMEGRDIVASAQTGTGKTAAFVLPSLDRLSAKPSTGKPRILILTPTRELASQITTAASKYGKFTRFNVVSLVGGMPYRQQLRALSGPVDMIVATPGRLLDHMENGRLNLSGIEILVLDEADRMLDMGFIDDVMDITKTTPKNRQTLLFSATVDSKLNRIIPKLLNNPVFIDLSNENMTPALIKQELYMVDSLQHKAKILRHLLDSSNMFKAIIFSATKINADKLAFQLQDQGYATAALHGGLKQSQRNRTIEDLRRGKIQFLVATDVAARGISIPDISHVINYDLPKFPEDYVHRIGRTGRAGAEGIAISLALPLDRKHLQRIEKLIEQRIQLKTIAGLEPSKQSYSADTREERPFKRGGKPSARRGGGDRNDRDERSFKPRGERPSYKRDYESDKPFKSRGDKPSFKRDGDSEKPFKSRSDRSSFKRDGDSERPFKSRSDRPSFKREGDSERPFKSRSDRPSFKRDGDSERPFKSRSDRPSFKRDGDSERPFKSRSDRPSFKREGDSERPFKSRSDRPSFKREGDSERPFKSRSDRPSFKRDGDSERPFKSRSDKPSFKREGDSERPFKSRADKPSFKRGRDRDDKPAARRGGEFAAKSGYERSAKPKKTFAKKVRKAKRDE